jgi:hypothetical protein
MKTTRYVISFDIGDKRFYFVDKNRRVWIESNFLNVFSENLQSAFLFKRSTAATTQFDFVHTRINAAIQNTNFYEFIDTAGIVYDFKDATNVRIRKVSVVVQLEEDDE